MGKWPLLWWGVLDEVDALFNVSLQALRASFDKLLLLVGDTSEDVDCLVGAVRLYIILIGCSDKGRGFILTPSSTGVEKKSRPVSLAIASPPGTPGK